MASNPIRGNVLRATRCACAVAALGGIFFAGAATSSCQDLGELARQAQARREAGSAHPAHVYTNDDLQRPQILIPDDKMGLGSARKPSGAAMAQPSSAAEPEQSQILPVSDEPQISLGEIARKYSKEKLARTQPLPVEPEPVVVAAHEHVYTNDDMDRDEILSPEDHARYEAALAKPSPAMSVTKTEQAPEEAAVRETPLGDVARAAYQQQQRALEAVQQSGARFSTVSAAPVRPVTSRRPVRAKSESAGLGRATAPLRAKRQPDGLENLAFVVIRVRSGDSLWKLARRHLGRGVRWRSLLLANPWIKDPNHLKAGRTIRI